MNALNPTTTDAALLRRYAETRNEEAFAELVHRRLALVYSAALRSLDGHLPAKRKNHIPAIS